MRERRALPKLLWGGLVTKLYPQDDRRTDGRATSHKEAGCYSVQVS